MVHPDLEREMEAARPMPEEAPVTRAIRGGDGEVMLWDRTLVEGRRS